MERIICCWGASTWSRFIGWLQIIGYALLMILYIVGFALTIAAISQANEHENDDAKAVMAVLITIFVIGILLTLVGIIMAVVLLKGTAQRHVGYLRVWVIYTIVSLIFMLIKILLAATLGNIRLGVVWFGFNIFSVFVVNTHINDFSVVKTMG